MIEGVGIDVVEVARIERAMRRPKFVERILTPAERAQGISAQRVAGRWAAKEAVAKAIGRPLRWQDVEIGVGQNGAPVCAVRGLEAGLETIVSITHERTSAAAVAIVQRKVG